MKSAKRIIIPFTAALLVAGLGTAEAGPGYRHYRHHFVPRAVIFAPLYAYPRYYYPPYYYAPAPPPVYIEQVPPPQVQPGVPPQVHSGALWYCPTLGAYYPSAPSCPSGWQRVEPPPPPGG